MAAPGHFTDALLLRSVDYRDTDRILTLLTRDLGKIAVMARGARRSTRRFGGALEPYALLRAEVALGRGEVGRLGQAQIARAFPSILRDLRKMTYAGAALELVREVAPAREPDERLFDVAVEVLETLGAVAAAREELWVAFQVRVLSIAGFSPGLDVCARCGKRPPDGKAARLDPALGGIVCRACGGGPVHLAGGTRSRLAGCVGGGWASAAAEPWEPRELAEGREAVTELVTSQLGRRLSGGQLVTQVTELGGAG